jgi:hypothetical protein
MSKRNRIYALENIRVLKEYVNEACNMSKSELEWAYAKLRFNHTSFSRLPENYYSDEFFNEEC